VSAPAAVRCPRCFYMPSSATIVCLQCRNELRESGPRPLCPYTHLDCDCQLRGHCLAGDASQTRF
jgi:hypothetical protein